MPGFVRTKADETRWSNAKEAAKKQTSEGSDSFYALSNYIYHKMGKSEEDQKMANFYKTELYKSLNPMKTGSGQLSVKIPKSKSMPGAFDKPSKFFKSESKSEELCAPKHPTLQKLYSFMKSEHKKKISE